MAKYCEEDCRVVLSLEPCETALRRLSETLEVVIWLRDDFCEGLLVDLLLEGWDTGLEVCRRDLRVCDSARSLGDCFAGSGAGVPCSEMELMLSSNSRDFVWKSYISVRVSLRLHRRLGDAMVYLVFWARERRLAAGKRQGELIVGLAQVQGELPQFGWSRTVSQRVFLRIQSFQGAWLSDEERGKRTLGGRSGRDGLGFYTLGDFILQP